MDPDLHSLDILPKRPALSAKTVALCAFVAIAAFFLLTEHRAHFFGALPWLLLLACPFLHFLHGGHGRSGHDSHESRGRHANLDSKEGES